MSDELFMKVEVSAKNNSLLSLDELAEINSTWVLSVGYGKTTILEELAMIFSELVEYESAVLLKEGVSRESEEASDICLRICDLLYRRGVRNIAERYNDHLYLAVRIGPGVNTAAACRLLAHRAVNMARKLEACEGRIWDKLVEFLIGMMVVVDARSLRAAMRDKIAVNLSTGRKEGRTK